VKAGTPDAVDVAIGEDAITIELADARKVAVPIAWYPRLLHAKKAELSNWRLIGGGDGIHWDDLDEDISVENVVAGKRSGESQSSFKRWLEART
jgi:hypothetical protein